MILKSDGDWGSVMTTVAVISEKGGRLSAFDAVFHAVAGTFE